ncbi:glycosyltransferase family 9 protein [Candidatus Pacearchaeota archaeon]|nr:glycosyltransferase family 9 protein [Candidatus Pacearchaeota archaeon]
MKICIIKLGADGDVLRTLPLAQAIKEKHKNAQITWITKGDIKDLLAGIDYIDTVLTLPYYGIDTFDILYNFDIDTEALELAGHIQAEKKYGFCAEGGYPAACTPGASYYLDTLFDDDLKKENTRTYQEMMFMAAELEYQNKRYELVLSEEDLRYAEAFAAENELAEKKLIGIHMGASSRWPSKVWHPERVKAFIRKASNEGYTLLLFGGPNEVESHEHLCAELESEGISIVRNNPRNTKRQFAALVSLCSCIVCSDSFALHISLGMGKNTIGLFFCTSPNEVEGYGLLTKLASPMLLEYFPERSDQYSEELTKSISEDEVLNALIR